MHGWELVGAGLILLGVAVIWVGWIVTREPVKQSRAWLVFSEDHLDASDAETILAESGPYAAERYAAEWDRGTGDGFAACQRVGVFDPRAGIVAVFFVHTDDGREYRAAGGYFRSATVAELAGAEHEPRP
jgi:hypothetical protein